ncbi:hypothetical protein [Streptomyces sp. NPDC005336]|uniref:hypothetical protein n=1 Tax=Streptomyces sp. NPDC005336 TaxID=3157035 RepID=UPI0033A5776A
MLDDARAGRAADQIDALQQEAAAAQEARSELADSVDAVRYLIAQSSAAPALRRDRPWHQLGRRITGSRRRRTR